MLSSASSSLHPPASIPGPSISKRIVSSSTIVQTGPDPHVQPLSLQSKKNTVLVSHGRPPWYGEDGTRKQDAFVIAVAGGSASGKTHVARQIVTTLGSIPSVIILSQDSFYKRHTPEEIELAYESKFDFDHPDALDMNLFAECLADLKQCKQSNIPVYSFSEHQRLDQTQYLYGAAIIITEGIMALQDPKLRELYDLKIFVQCDSDLMLARRILRDVKERGRDVDGILEQYLRYVKPAYDHFVQPTSAHADIIVPGSNNSVAIELICTHVRRKLQDRTNQFRERMCTPRLPPRTPGASPRNSALIEPDFTLLSLKDQDAKLGLTVLKQTNQIKGIFTILRNHATSKQDFIFFSDRLATTLMEHALQFLPYAEKAVETPVAGQLSKGHGVAAEYICGVTIQRSGSTLERGFRRVIKDVPVGSLLIQSDAKSGEPLLLQVKLPVYVRRRNSAEKCWVFVFDSQVGTAAAAFMSIRILLDHGVPESHIIFVTFLVARQGGVAVLRKAFPKIKIVCGAVDDAMKEGWLQPEEEDLESVDGKSTKGRKIWIMEPGMGQIGDRYYL